MKIINLNTKNIFTVDYSKPNENQSKCPECSQTRKHKNNKSFSWNNSKMTGYCQNCQGRFVEFKTVREKINYFIPTWGNKTELTDGAVKWFEGRKITQKTLIQLKIYSDLEFMPQDNKETGVVCMPYFYNDKLFNIKYRTKDKHFKLVKDAEKIFYNLDCVSKYNEIIITEGEIDAMSFIEVGINNVISVPNGANNTGDYINNYIELFDNKKIIIAVDNDLAGLSLKDELIRRFGSENCYTINFKECKDANEFLIKYGALALQDAYANKQEIQIDGIINIDKCYDDIYSLYLNGMQKGKLINDELDNIISWESGRLAIWTGIPTHGKSEYLDEVCVKLNYLHNWKVAYFSPENYPIKYHFAKLASKISGLPFNSYKLSNEEFESIYDYIENNFYFIYPEEDYTLDSILDKAKYLVRKNGIKILNLDPYNKFEHLQGNESETNYISKFLDKLAVFAKKYDVLINLVAHPTKMKKIKDSFKYEVPTLYDIAGSAHFANKADYGLTIYRDFEKCQTEIYVNKVKFKHLGDGGVIYKTYNYFNGRYENIGLDVNQWSDKSIFYKPENNNTETNVDFETEPLSEQNCPY